MGIREKVDQAAKKAIQTGGNEWPKTEVKFIGPGATPTDGVNETNRLLGLLIDKVEGLAAQLSYRR